MRTHPEKSPRIYVYGPVPSRRLGFSLGIDIIPFKTCTLDCVYCQLGRTPEKTLQRKKFFTSAEIVAQIKEKLSSGQRIDIITFSGSGEPTLNKALGELIKGIKKITSIRVAVLTNSTLFADTNVRKSLTHADLIVPSLDAATQKVFLKTNRPCAPLKIKDVIEGLVKFRQEFTGQIWLEIMLVKGVNDSPSHIQKLKEAASRIKPDKIQLNTVVRPPAEKSARPLSHDELKKIKKIFGRNCEIIAEFDKKQKVPAQKDLEIAILEMIQRRPVTLLDISVSLGRHANEVIKYLDLLMNEGKIQSVKYKDSKYYETV
ncbi:MAG: radical SAM protein [Candidatus Aminicenantes bacterium]